MHELYDPPTTEGVRAEVAKLAEAMSERVFGSGSTGFFVQGRIFVGGRQFLVNLQAVEAGSKGGR